MGTVNVGFNNFLPVESIVAVMNFSTSSADTLAESAKHDNKLLDFTNGRRRHSLIIFNDGYVAQSALVPLTLGARINRM